MNRTICYCFLLASFAMGTAVGAETITKFESAKYDSHHRTYQPAKYAQNSKLVPPQPKQNLNVLMTTPPLTSPLSRQLPFCTNATTLAQGNSAGFLSYTAMARRTILYNDQTNTAAGSILYAHDAGGDGLFGTSDDVPGIVLGQSYNEWGAALSEDGRYAIWQRNHLSHLEYLVYDSVNGIFGDADDAATPFSIGTIQNRNAIIYALPRVSGDIVSWHDYVIDTVFWCTLGNTPGVTHCRNGFDSRDLSRHWFVRDAYVHADAANPVPHIYFTGWDLNPSVWKAQTISYPGLNAASRVEQADARTGTTIFGAYNFNANSNFSELSLSMTGFPFRHTFRPQGGIGQVRNPVVSKRPGVFGEFLVTWENFRSMPNPLLVEVGPVFHANGPQELFLPNPLGHNQLYPSIDGNAVGWLDYPMFNQTGVTELQVSYCAF